MREYTEEWYEAHKWNDEAIVRAADPALYAAGENGWSWLRNFSQVKKFERRFRRDEIHESTAENTKDAGGPSLDPLPNGIRGLPPRPGKAEHYENSSLYEDAVNAYIAALEARIALLSKERDESCEQVQDRNLE